MKKSTANAVCDKCRLQTCRLTLGLAKLELLLAKLALRIGIGIGIYSIYSYR